MSFLARHFLLPSWVFASFDFRYSIDPLLVRRYRLVPRYLPKYLPPRKYQHFIGTFVVSQVSLQVPLKVLSLHSPLLRFLSQNPSVGLGTWAAAPNAVGGAITTAVKVGYRHIDCAQMYGNEKQIGVALKKVFKDGLVKREDLWITSKLWNTDHAPEDVPKALNRTLRDLQLDYVDLYLIHWPGPDIPSTWRAMEALFDSGKARAIGVSNFSVNQLEDLLAVARVTPAVNQVKIHPGYSPLGASGTPILKNPIVTTVAEKLGKTPAQVALRWGLQMGHSVVPKSTNEARIEQNFDVFDWSIPENLFAKFSESEKASIGGSL
ncbi:hypothetical protein GH714_009690 [Hevea brasiliensis]|uniref:NADP-dependent oxidoreductase domain-containing protein n=1 Tax=Hevea brasiliensis TaxID=3981 RepID=A0A6A6KKM5_HEVBR|nr:hypothetical protein GH714_009690 [Hevea brasiliensis]